MTTELPRSLSRTYDASPAAARMTTTRFIRLGPAPSAPRSPAVPNSRVPAKRSARSCSSPRSAAAITSSSSARVCASGSSAAQARASSIRSVSAVMDARYPSPSPAVTSWRGVARAAGGHDVVGGRCHHQQMIDHLGINCTDLPRAAAFYDRVLGVLGHRRIMDVEVAIGYGTDAPDFWISTFEGV